ncbi:prepilin peptidase [Isoptericola sp. NPDC056605]|uniref:prepilin peptidase n=1 Tax=Isoptericola sp. NPDC056605 TaxID=3345876 RepID=UPI0036AFAF1F
MPLVAPAPAAVLVGAAVGLLAGVVLWRWLRTGTYRYDTDEPRSRLERTWAVVPMAAAGGAVAGFEPWPLTAAAGVYLVGGAVLVWIDLDVHRVPDAVTRVWGPAVALAVAVPAVVAGDWGVLGRALGGALVLGILFAVMAFFSMGLGDVKLAVVTGLVVGPLGVSGVVTALVATCVVAALMAVALLARGAGRKAHLAYGPALVAGVAVALLVPA